MDFCTSNTSFRSYSMHQLKILNEVDCAVWIATYQPGDTRFVWANEAALRFWNKPSIDAFISTDLVTGRSVAVSIVHDELYNDVQVRFLSLE
jgi:hypothetical protein